MIALAAWLARYDVARRTVHGRGVTRYMAVALLAGYVWLAVAGGLWAGVGQMADGAAYDAELHAVFLGFVMSMIFAHAPVIVSSVLGRPLPYRRGLYVPLALLHVSLVLRLGGGDWAGDTVAWQWGGSLNEVAIVLFLAMAAVVVARARQPVSGVASRLRTRPAAAAGPASPTGPPIPDPRGASPEHEVAGERQPGRDTTTPTHPPDGW